MAVAFARANLVTLKAVLTNPLTRRSVVELAIAASVVTSPRGDRFIDDDMIL
ncbi:hypothetical protein [Lacipirellula parvula]|uniref:Uncharacterized protein n=1 Tax=Lacipirellula parvula TaxID=2650471 RepID=A0A5K7XD65_9BACT|nr:hypothetical protein [Lacipirellula parvula]BBO32263.1 hypothetical protein PLANPX_1875 [Lacipirellula parvula]